MADSVISVEVKSEGFEQIVANVLDGAPKQVRIATAAGYARSQELVPFKTGFLRASGEWDANGNEGEFGYRASYAPAVEYGGHGRPARSYVRAAAEEQADPFFEACAGLLRL